MEIIAKLSVSEVDGMKEEVHTTWVELHSHPTDRENVRVRVIRQDVLSPVVTVAASELIRAVMAIRHAYPGCKLPLLE